MLNNNGSIGVFDSGLGGLTVVRALRKIMPNESIVYLGDTARVPYGNKSAKLVKEYSLQIADFLVKQNAKLIVVACNTASALALEVLEKTLKVPVVGVIIPGAETAESETTSGAVGVLGTLATIGSKAYENALKEKNKNLVVTSQACPLLVPIAEEGWLEGKITEDIIRVYLEPVIKAGVDTIILGCTHYPILKNAIQAVVEESVVLVDSADAAAKTVKTTLIEKDISADAGSIGNLDIFVTDLPSRFEAVAQRFLGEQLPPVKTVHLPEEKSEI